MGLPFTDEFLDYPPVLDLPRDTPSLTANDTQPLHVAEAIKSVLLFWSKWRSMSDAEILVYLDQDVVSKKKLEQVLRELEADGFVTLNEYRGKVHIIPTKKFAQFPFIRSTAA